MRMGSAVLLAMLAGACSEDTVGSTCADVDRGPAFDGFADVTAQSGIAFDYSTTDFKGGGLGVADFDGDGRYDIVAGRRTGGVALYLNRGGLRFEEIVDSGLDARAATTAITTADLDNDDDRDIVIATHGAMLIYGNRGDGTFEEAARIVDTGSTEHVLPTDLDGDGQLDLYLGNYDVTRLDGTTNQLHMNRGSLQFELAHAAGYGRTWTTTAFDYDDDGDQDLYVANDTLAFDFGAGPVSAYPFPVDAFLRNDGVGPDGFPVLTDIAGELAMTEARSSMGGLLADFDDDGRLDLYVPNFGANKLFLREPGGGYVERAGAFGLAAISRSNERCGPDSTSEHCLLLSWSATLSDFDLDGRDELLLTNGETQIGGPPPVQLFVRGAGAVYQEVTPSIPCLDARGLVATDLDGDGDQDVVIAVKDGALRIFENTHRPAPGTWLDVRLRGATSNREGIGAVVTIRQASGRVQSRVVGSGGVIHSAGPAEAFFSLGADPLREVLIRWPNRQPPTSLVPRAGDLVVAQP